MRSIFILLLSFGALAACAAAQNSEVSLGDVARQQQHAKKQTAKKVVTNEDLERSKGLTTSTAIAVQAAPQAKPAAEKKETAAESKKASDALVGDATKATPLDQTYRASIRQKRAEIAKLEKEIADADYKLRVQSTNYYTDAGSRLRDPKAWTEQRAKMDKEMADNRQKLQEARSSLDDLLEQARKFGIPAGALE